MRALISTALLFLAGLAHGASYDPDLTWRSIETDHFRIHFHQGIEPIAEEFSQIVDDIYDTMTDELEWHPRRRTELVLVDRTDSANGYAVTVPYNAIVIYVTAPTEASTLDYYEDWAETITTHELTHVLHIDSNHGLVRLARSTVGRVATTNRLSPRWMVEGLATLQETRHTTGGRGRAPIADMIKRTAVVDDDFPPLGNLSGFQADPPSGNLRYLFGQDFMQHVADQSGDRAWTEWVARYGSSIPYLLPSKRVFGDSLVSHYRGWEDAMTERYTAQLEPVIAEGVLEGRLISGGVASCGAPAFSPNGDHLVWSCSDRQTGSAIWISDGSGFAPEVLLENRGASSFTWRSDSKAFAYSGMHIVNRFNTFSDVYLHDLGSKRTTSLTSGARARDPEFSPDGSKLWVVTNKAQNNQIEQLTVDKRRIALTENTDHTQYSSPRFAPDGNSVAVSSWQNGRRDLWLYTPEGEPLRRLTADAHPDRTPRWSADGRWLFFSSDRSGIPNIYAIEIATERLYQVTNVRTGAIHPSISPDGKLLAYQQYSADGWDVRILDIDPDQFLDRGLLPRDLTADSALADLVTPVEEASVATLDWSGEPLAPSRRPSLLKSALAGFPQDSESVDSFDQPEGLDVFGDEQDFPFTLTPKRYNPLPGLAPRYWLPFINTTAVPSNHALGGLRLPNLRLSAATGASDPLRFLAWSAGAHFRTDAMYGGGYFGLTVNRWIPVYSAAISHSVRPLPLTDATDPDRRLVYWDRHTVGNITVSYPYTFRTWIFGRYSLDVFDGYGGIPDNAGESPLQGRIGELSLGWRYSYSQPTAYAISAEDARVLSLVVGLVAPQLGTRLEVPGVVEPSGLTQVRVTAEARQYVVNPWIPNHVLAGRAGAGIAIGQSAAFEDATFLGRYSLGGSFGDGSFAVTPDQFRMLRGYPTGAKSGDMYWLAGLEYRLPLWRIDRGVGTIPAFLRALSGVVFFDAGNAFSTVNSVDDLVEEPLIGVGGELRLSGIYWYNTSLTGRLGYGTGLTAGGYPYNDARTVYFRLGGSF
ncbi:MAG: PD40 domain-containing protein [Proteobacteria bacterium]|nr:PD40 domain-containing protein [Pseudomonadota bacterium]